MTQPEQSDNLKNIAEAQSRFREFWCPKDPMDARNFTRELDYLVHLIYREAAAPFLQYWISQAARHPGPIIRVPAKPDLP